MPDFIPALVQVPWVCFYQHTPHCLPFGGSGIAEWFKNNPTQEKILLLCPFYLHPRHSNSDFHLSRLCLHCCESFGVVLQCEKVAPSLSVWIEHECARVYR